MIGFSPFTSDRINNIEKAMLFILNIVAFICGACHLFLEDSFSMSEPSCPIAFIHIPISISQVALAVREPFPEVTFVNITSSRHELSHPIKFIISKDTDLIPTIGESELAFALPDSSIPAACVSRYIWIGGCTISKFEVVLPVSFVFVSMCSLEHSMPMPSQDLLDLTDGLLFHVSVVIRGSDVHHTVHALTSRSGWRFLIQSENCHFPYREFERFDLVRWDRRIAWLCLVLCYCLTSRLEPELTLGESFTELEIPLKGMAPSLLFLAFSISEAFLKMAVVMVSIVTDQVTNCLSQTRS